jgi:hydroxypyruvate reductase
MFHSGADRERRAAEMRACIRQFFQRALEQATVEKAFARNVDCERGVLRIHEDLYELNSYSRTFVVSIGKAAHSLASALEQQTGSRFEGIIASSTEPTSQLRGFRYFRGGHPTPNSDSLRAADAMLKSLSAQNAASLVIFLLSGGGSSMAEKPIDGEISLDDVISAYRALVHSGAPIGEINAIRKHLSAIKGGRLAQAAYAARQVSLLVSDVPDDTPDALASGPTMPDSTSTKDCYEIAAKYNLLEQLPNSVSELFRRRALEETPKSDDPAFIHSRWWTILSNKTALDAAAETSKQAGFSVEVDNSCDDWDYNRAADYLLTRVRELRQKTDRVCLISGGEVTVKVIDGGIGGRNQQFALACAQKIQGENITVLSAGTDGIDGNSPAAGAVADGTTIARAHAHSLDVVTAAAKFDAYPFFESLGDAIVTGPTGNNVRDLRILLAY